jgi:hypothetical protein
MSDTKSWQEVTMENSETWDRKESIEGKLVKVQESVGPNESMLYTLKTDKGMIGVWGSTVLDTKFEGISNGSMVKIEPQGKVKSEKTGREYQDFKVFVKPPEFEEVTDVPDDLSFDMPKDFLT